ncbi:MAG: dephospho-CoA kinase [Verrucomicrobiota bacterium]
MVIGLTGGIGCGKSAAAACFVESGFVHVDADALAHQALRLPEVAAALRARWGGDCLAPDGFPDRSWIAEKVFGDRVELEFLESLIHPLVAELRRAAVADGKKSYVVEIPLLFEKRLESQFDCVVCVACSDSVRMRRLQNRGLSPAESESRIKSQMPLGHKVKLSDRVLWNDGDRAFLRGQVDRLVAELVSGRGASR